MACNCVTNKCNSCRNFVTTGAVTISGTTLVLQIPSNNYLNNQEVCICVAQPIPAGTTSSLNVVIQIGTDTTNLYPLRTKCGHNIYADQIKTRTLYCTRVATDSTTFVYNGRCPLPCTSAIMTGSLPVTQVTNAATTATVNNIPKTVNVTSENGVNTK